MTNKAPEAPAAKALRERSGEHPKRRIVVIAGSAVAAVALVVGGVFGVNAANDYRAAIEASERAAADYYDAAAKQSELAQAAAEAAAESAEAASAAVTSAEAAEEAAASQAAADEAAAAAAASLNGGGSSNGAPGDAVPFIPSSDPNNANGGDYIDPGIYCQSGSASTVGGVPVCD